VLGVIVSIGNNRGRRKAFCAGTSSGCSVASVSIIIIIIIALTLLLAEGGGFVLFNPMLMITTTAFAQEENNTTAGATTTSDANTTTTSSSSLSSPSSGIELSSQPIWEEEVSNIGVTPINETHTIIAFMGNGTMTVPDTGETINMINNGTAFVSPVTGSAYTVSAYGRENVFSEDDDDTTAITFYEIVQGDPATLQTKGVIIAVFDTNATGTLAPFNGMITVGIHDEQPNAEAATITLWEWESGIGNNAGVTPPIQRESSPMNTTTTSELPSSMNMP
jgi:hypothetical protein